jgi:hypothetical protein
LGEVKEIVKSSIFWDLTPCSPSADVSEQVASISFLATYFTLVFCMAYFSTREDGGDRFFRNVG